VTCFRQLLSLRLDHAFFAPRACRVLRFEPDAASAAALAATGCVLRSIDTGFELCHDAAAAAALSLQLRQARPWQLRFLGVSRDPLFASYTEGLAGCDQPLCFAGWDAVEHEFAAQRRLRVAPEGAAAVVRQSRGLPPVCAVTLTLEPDILSRAPFEYLLAFAARAPHWKYYFTGDWHSQPLRVVDAAGLVEFTAARVEQLPDGTRARVIFSERAMALHERPQQHLALRTSQGAIDRVLIKRLPLASPTHLARASIANETRWIAEIYVAS